MERPQAVRTRTRRRVAALGSLAGVLLLLAAAVAAPAQAAPGDLDLTFSGDGKQTTDFGFGLSNAAATVRQPDGKIVAVGTDEGHGSVDFALARYNANGSLDTSFAGDGKQTTENFGTPTGVALQGDGKIVVVGTDGADFALARYNPNGSLDTSFSGDGKQTTDFGGPGGDGATGVAIQAGKIVAVGYGGTQRDFVVARYNPNGSLDTSFGFGGSRTTNFGGTDVARGVAIQGDGKIVAVGRAGGADFRFGLARYNPNGSLDMSFSGGGMQTTDFGAGDDEAQGVALQGDGKIVVVGVAGGGDFALARYNLNGSLDTSLSGDGRQRTDFGADDGANGVTLQGGKIVAVGGGGAGGDFALARYNPNGSLDASFSGDGKQTTDFGGDDDQAAGVALQSGKVVAVGFVGCTCSIAGSKFVLARYNPNGTLDTSFSGDGKQTTNFGGGRDLAAGVAVQGDGKIVAVGDAGPSGFGDFALTRYNPNGSLDTSFSGDGRQTTDFGDSDGASGVAVQDDGKTVVAGFSFNGTDSEFALARYNPNGSLDTTFSADGKQTTSFGGIGDQATGVAIQGDGKIVAVGGGGNGDFALARYNPNGSLDTSFSGDGKQTTDFGGAFGDRATGVALQGDGKIVAVGFGGNGDFALARYNPNGSLDTSFSGRRQADDRRWLRLGERGGAPGRRQDRRGRLRMWPRRQ